MPNTPVTELYSVGPAVAQRLKRLGLRTAEDIIYHYPSRYDDFSKIKKIDSLSPAQQVTIKGKIDAIQNRRSWQRRLNITEALISDDTGTVKVIWFNQPYLAKSFAPGDRIVVSGKLEMDKYGLHFTSPSYEKIGPTQIHTGRLVPVYPATDGLTQRHLRYLTQLVMPLVRQAQDYLPFELRQEHHLLDLQMALQQIHFPKNEAMLKRAQERLKFDELFPINVYVLQNRRQSQQTPAEPVPFDEKLTKSFVKKLPFTLTGAQRRSAWEILKDMGRIHPMNRLLEGDVGSGKTIVAGLAVLNAARAGFQTVLMAPTEILAQQHYQTFCKLFRGRPITVGLLTRNNKTISTHSQSLTRPAMLKAIGSGKVGLIIGTQALVQEGVGFHQLGLAMVDEQHRFGVDQRQLIVNKARSRGRNNEQLAVSPHFLSITATPIPRTLALSLYGDLDISRIDEMPPGRQETQTKIVPPHERKNTYDFINHEIASGRQVFIICPLIDPSDKLGVKSVTEEHKRLSERIFPHLTIGLLHGRLASDKRETVMKKFLDNHIQILVSTSVIEVGIDVPNATVMMIEGAERFGLAQLHQFRGRVGRGKYQSYCFLLTETESDTAIKRLQAVAASHNGFELAEQDLELRGPGEIYGYRQSGFPAFKIARLTDFPIMTKSQHSAQNILSADPNLTHHPLVQEKMRRFRESIHWE
ncbi:MAG: ATP-dependent DNA helicase RecG [Patescibacteria group bacterium]